MISTYLIVVQLCKDVNLALDTRQRNDDRWHLVGRSHWQYRHGRALHHLRSHRNALHQLPVGGVVCSQ
jgi:hypothetical protein